MMRMTGTIALAAVLATAAAPALAGEWVYHGGPKSPDSLTWYDQDAYGTYGSAPYAAYGDGPYVAGPAYGWDAPSYRYRCGPATSDCYHGSRQLQGTR